MRKIMLILVGILIVQSGYKIIPVLAAKVASPPVSPASQGEDFIEAKKTMEAFLQCFVVGNIECAMSRVSKNLSVKDNVRTSGYDELKIYLVTLFQSTKSRSIDNLKIIESKVSNNEVTVLIEYHTKAFNLDNSMAYEKTRKEQYSLIKEENSWKIVAILRMS